MALGKFLIPSSPLLHQCRGKSARQAEDQAGEPQHVDLDGRCCWFEWLIAPRYDDREGCPSRHVDKLLSYLDKEGVGRIDGVGR